MGNEPVLSGLAKWGFDLLVPPVAEAFCNRGRPHVVALNLRKAGGGLIYKAGIQLPDVLDPR
ncbi:MAG: hypothetical protein J6386_10730 [Candidatus Synoicihabitans palmerolidicus]|nr:hypothetical protein [Candidatus Synoicihabitans palmerolidicus]